MYLIGNKGVKVAVNREGSVETICSQLTDLPDRELERVVDYIRGLQAARKFLKRT